MSVRAILQVRLKLEGFRVLGSSGELGSPSTEEVRQSTVEFYQRRYRVAEIHLFLSPMLFYLA